MAGSVAGSAATPAVAVLVAAGVAHAVRAYGHDAAVSGAVGYGAEAAAALGVDPARVLKTLVVAVEGLPAAAAGGPPGGLVVTVLPVAARLDLRAVAAAVGGKRAAMAAPAAAQRATGCVVGGISPLGQRRRLPVLVDAGALAHATVLVSAGRRGLDVELAPADLVALTGATTAAVAAR